MRLTNVVKKIKEIPDIPKDIFVLSLIILFSSGTYMLGGVLLKGNRTLQELRVIAPPATKEGSDKGESGRQGIYVGSRSGTTYHLPWCSGALRIREENKIWFTSRQEAETSGYRPAKNCKGI